MTTNVPECIGLHTHLPAWPSATMAPQVLIVGAGVTGSMLALLAKDMGLSVRVLEKSVWWCLRSQCNRSWEPRSLVMENLKKVEYAARFAVAYFFDKSKVSWPFPWTVKYFDKGGWAVSAYDA